MKILPWLSIPIMSLIFWLGQQVYSHYDQPPLWLVIVGLITLLGLIPKVHPLAWLWWGGGLLTLLWSQTPGNTLVVGLWELVYLAAFAAGAFVPGIIGLGIALTGYGLFTNLSLSAVGINSFFSGSSYYIYGAQALVLIPALALYMFRSKQWQLTSGIALVGASYLALMSGARAVYLPLVVIFVLLVWKLWRVGIHLRQIALGLGAVALAIAVIDFALPFHPIQTALGTRANLSKQIEDTQAEGSFSSRLQMWNQTLHIAIQEPLGTGNGSFRDVLAAYQQYPSVSFANAHNYYLETAATGGWLRLILLIGLLGWILIRAWRSPAWPWALGSAGLWATLAFDITGMYPSVMMLAFAALGAAYGQLPQSRNTRLNVVPAIAGLTLAIGLVLWWYWPCASNCATGRHLGYRPEVLSQVATVVEPERTVLLNKATQFNPKSLWVYRAKLQYAATPQEKLEVLRTLTRQFPLASPVYYLQRAQIALGLGFKDEAKQTLETGLKHFPPGFKPAGVPFGDSIYQLYENWSLEAPRLLKSLQNQ